MEIDLLTKRYPLAFKEGHSKQWVPIPFFLFKILSDLNISLRAEKVIYTLMGLLPVGETEITISDRSLADLSGTHHPNIVRLRKDVYFNQLVACTVNKRHPTNTRALSTSYDLSELFRRIDIYIRTGIVQNVAFKSEPVRDEVVITKSVPSFQEIHQDILNNARCKNCKQMAINLSSGWCQKCIHKGQNI